MESDPSLHWDDISDELGSPVLLQLTLGCRRKLFNERQAWFKLVSTFWVVGLGFRVQGQL